MGLASALNTALTGLTAAETTIDVVGNNLANSNTIGFKASEAFFATQFLQTLSLGAAPTASSGGVNPRQVGLGVMVAGITPDFSQGTIQISSSPTDLAIQGDGFFIVRGATGEQLYTRNGAFKFNATNELTTLAGNRLLGYGVDDQYQVERIELAPITIPLGSSQVAQATQNVYLEGTLIPSGVLADTATILDTVPLYADNLGATNITAGTLLTDLYRADGASYANVFQQGTFHFTGRKGGRALDTRDLQITGTTTVQNLTDFMDQAQGIRQINDDPLNPLPDGAAGAAVVNPGGSVYTDAVGDTRLRLVGNNGTDNALAIMGVDMSMTLADGSAATVTLPWTEVQDAVGESTVADFLAYDSLGIPLRVRLTAVLESRDNTSTTYRWFADSVDNGPAQGAEIAVGTGLVTFDGEGQFISSTQETVSIDRDDVSSASPLEFDLDLSQLAGLAVDNSTLAITGQDGFAPGVLSSFMVGEGGTIRGVFSNGVTRILGQLQLARFANNEGLEQRGLNLFSEGINSGLPIQADAGQQGTGTLVAGALELSNTEIGGNLIDLILASTMYRGNTRVITTAQQMLDELLALRR